MKKMLARIGYDKQKDEYQLLTSSDNGETWDFSMGCKCVMSEHAENESEPMYVHISLIEELKKCIALGYEIVY